MKRPIRSSISTNKGRYPLLTWLQNIQHHAQTIWTRRTPRERVLLMAGGLAVLLLGIWLVALKPALSSIQINHQRIVHLQSDLARVQALGLQAQPLRSRAQMSDMPAPSVTDLQRSLAQAGLTIAVVPLSGSNTSMDSAHWQLHIEQAKVDDLMPWLAGAIQAYNLRIVRATLLRAEKDHRDRPGYVTGIITLASSGKQP